MEAARHGRFGEVLPHFRVLATLFPSGFLIPALLSWDPPCWFVDEFFGEWLKIYAAQDRRPHFAFSQFATTWSKLNSFDSLWRAYCSFRQRYPPHALIINQLTSACRSCGKFSLVADLWADVPRFGIEPDTTMIRSFASAAADGRIAELALQLFRHCQTTKLYDQVIMGQLIKTFVETDNVTLALDLINWFYESNTEVGPLNALLSVLCRVGRYQEAFHQYECAKVRPSERGLASLLAGCAAERDLALGRRLHAVYQASGSHSLMVLTALVAMYAKCGCVDEARTVFDCIKHPDVMSFNIMIQAYTRAHQSQHALALYKRMVSVGRTPNEFTFSSLLGGCASQGPGALQLVGEVDAAYTASGLDSPMVATALIDLYGNLGCVDDARRVFESTTQPNLSCFNSIIAVYCRHMQFESVMQIYEKMRACSVVPDEHTYSMVLSTCGTAGRLDVGRQVHAAYTAAGLDSLFVSNALVTLYGKCGCLDEARKLFGSIQQPNVVSFNALMIAYCQQGQLQQAMQLYKTMGATGMSASDTTYAILLSACASQKDISLGRELHAACCAAGLLSLPVCNTLISMYGKCGGVEEALQVFASMQQRDVVSYNSIIAVLCQAGRLHQAVQLYDDMAKNKLLPDEYSYASLFAGCAAAADLTLGRQLHTAYKHTCLQSVVVSTALIDMYGKCGSVEEAGQVFEGIPQPDVVSYNAMIQALGVNGHAQQALHLFQQMLSAAVAPNSATFSVVLSACSHGGLVEPALQIYNSIGQHHVTVNSEHLTCLVDVLGRSGRLQEAEDLALQSDLADEVTWTSVLGACRIHQDVKRAERIAERLIRSNPTNAAPYIVLMNIYTSLGQYSEAQAVRDRREAAGAEVTVGISSTDINGVTTSFGPADFSHPLGAELRQKCLEIASRISSAGHLPDVSWSTRNESDEARRLSLCFHSERIAIAFNLLTTPAGSRIRITKNLRVCGDCHEATKVIARVYGRDISVRDRSRWHEFRTNGTCSCRDYF